MYKTLHDFKRDLRFLIKANLLNTVVIFACQEFFRLLLFLCIGTKCPRSPKKLFALQSTFPNDGFIVFCKILTGAALVYFFLYLFNLFIYKLILWYEKKYLKK